MHTYTQTTYTLHKLIHTSEGGGYDVIRGRGVTNCHRDPGE